MKEKMAKVHKYNLSARKAYRLNAGDKLDRLYAPLEKQPKNVKSLEDKKLAYRLDPVYEAMILTYANATLIVAMQAGHGWIDKAFGKCPFSSGDILEAWETIPNALRNGIAERPTGHKFEVVKIVGCLLRPETKPYFTLGMMGDEVTGKALWNYDLTVKQL